MSTILEINKLEKHYGKKQVLNSLSFQIGEGQIVGLLGPNGSGKTTLIKSMAGLFQDYKGSILIKGHKPDSYTKSIVSYLPERTYLSKWMTVKDAILMFDDFYEDFNQEKAWDMMRNLGLEKNQKTQTMSKGMQEKLQLILVMSRKAKLYLLDEPIGGVDPAARDYILDTIIRNYTGDSSILLSTHLIHDVERIFDRVLFLKDGNITIDEHVDVLREKHGKSIDELFREVYQA